MQPQQNHLSSIHSNKRKYVYWRAVRKDADQIGARDSSFKSYATDQRLNLGAVSFLLLVAAFLLPGLIGHDPWKQDETYIFGMIQHLLESGDWVVPTLAGEPFMEKPPLYYWIGAAFAWLLSPWIPLHDAARLATGFFMIVTSGALGWTVRHWWGAGIGRYGVLTLLGCLGVVFYAHLMLTDIPLLTGFSIAACGFALARQRPFGGGFLLGVGVGVGFLSKGVLAPAVLGLVTVTLPLCFKTWRVKPYFRAMAFALLVALPSLLIWPIALYWRSPALFMDWFWLNNVGRFVGFSVPQLGAPHTEGFWSETLPWFTFPALPLALVTLWRNRSTVLSSAPMQFSLVLFAVLMAVLGISASARPNYALPLLLPICLLAAPAAVTLPVQLDRIWDWSARIVFGSFAAAICAIWAWMLFHGGLPAQWGLLGRYLPLDFKPHLDFNAVAMAPWIILLSLAIVWQLPEQRGRGLLSWVTGITLCWGLVGTLWLEWIDTAKSYRSVFASMNSAIPYEHQCIASAGLGESERAMLHYVLSINTQRQENGPADQCDVLLINGLASAPPQDINPDHWQLVWDGARPSDDRERFWLYKASYPTSTLAAVSSKVRLPNKQTR
ncbi:MAG TPA: glycosyl transferase [Burkholderiaceae bacterium]|nr:glycosyl transferase [Burkholderiaceae bacterium]